MYRFYWDWLTSSIQIYTASARCLDVLVVEQRSMNIYTACSERAFPMLSLHRKTCNEQSHQNSFRVHTKCTCTTVVVFRIGIYYRNFTFESKLDKSFFDLNPRHVTYHLWPPVPVLVFSGENMYLPQTHSRD